MSKQHMTMENVVIVWQGRTRQVEFSYQDFNGYKTRRQVDISAVMYDPVNDETYLQGFCHLRNEERTFKTFNIKTMIKVGSKRYEIWEWFDECLGIPAPWHHEPYDANSGEKVEPIRSVADITKIEAVEQKSPSFIQLLNEYNEKQDHKVEKLKAKAAHVKATKQYSPAEKIALKLVKPLWISAIALFVLVVVAKIAGA